MDEKKMKSAEGEKRGILNLMFPSNYDFYGMLSKQAEQTERGVRALYDWLNNDGHSDPVAIVQEEDKGDQIRFATERQLSEAFSTPFDRQDIYTMSRQMDHILNYSLSTAYEMRAFGVEPDEAIMKMTLSLLKGTEFIAKCVNELKKDPKEAEALIPLIREQEHEIERTYVASMAKVFNSEDAVLAMKKREIYHHIKDAGRNMSITIDVLHRIIVGIS